MGKKASISHFCLQESPSKSWKLPFCKSFGCLAAKSHFCLILFNTFLDMLRSSCEKFPEHYLTLYFLLLLPIGFASFLILVVNSIKDMSYTGFNCVHILYALFFFCNGFTLFIRVLTFNILGQEFNDLHFEWLLPTYYFIDNLPLSFYMVI